MSSVIGIDLGGTKIAAARYSADNWHEETAIKENTEADQGTPHVLQKLSKIIQDLVQEDTVGIGIGVPGLVQQPEGLILHMPNIPKSQNIQLAQELSSATGLPISVDNDANCFALAEARMGAGKNHSVVTAITMGTGVGGGIILDGKIFHGAHGYSGEFGHMLLQPGQVPYDTADTRGDVEQYLSGTAMGKRCAAANRPEEYLEGEVCEFMRPDVFKEVAWFCTNLIHILNPSIIVFGGSVGRALKPHIASVQRELENWVLPGTPLPELHIAELPNASTLGAALLCSNLSD